MSCSSTFTFNSSLPKVVIKDSPIFTNNKGSYAKRVQTHQENTYKKTPHTCTFSKYQTPSMYQHSKRNPFEADSEVQQERTEVKTRHEFRDYRPDQTETQGRRYSLSISPSKSEKNYVHSQSLMKTASQKARQHNEDVDSEQLLRPSTSSQGSRRKRARQRKLRMFTSTPLYVPNKRVKKNPDFFEGRIDLFDSIIQETVQFRVFKESELGYSRIVQEKLRKSKIDDDCPTDSEQLELATRHVQKQLRQGIEMNESDSSESSELIQASYSFSSSFPSFGEMSQKQKKEEKYVYTSSEEMSSQEIAKKLSFDKVETQESP